MHDVFARKQLNKGGSPSHRYLINGEFVAMLDYYVVTCPSAKVANADAMDANGTLYFERVAVYKALDGTGGRRDQLFEQLTSWLAAFPGCTSRKRT